MLIGILKFFFFIFNLFLIILVVMQKNYGGFWSGPAGNDSVTIFGGNQGAGVLQKITWFFGTILIIGALFLAIYEAKVSQVSIFYKETRKLNTKQNTQLKKEAEIKEAISPNPIPVEEEPAIAAERITKEKKITEIKK